MVKKEEENQLHGPDKLSTSQSVVWRQELLGLREEGVPGFSSLTYPKDLVRAAGPSDTTVLIGDTETHKQTTLVH